MKPGQPLRNRIVDYRKVKASALKPHPMNWRAHPEGQREALRAVLGEIGLVGAPIVRQLADGSYELVDGHLRADIAGEPESWASEAG